MSSEMSDYTSASTAVQCLSCDSWSQLGGHHGSHRRRRRQVRSGTSAVRRKRHPKVVQDAAHSRDRTTRSAITCLTQAAGMSDTDIEYYVTST